MIVDNLLTSEDEKSLNYDVAIEALRANTIRDTYTISSSEGYSLLVERYR